MATRIVYVKSVKDYEEVPDHGETLVFREKGAGDEDEDEEIEEIEEVLRADLRVLGRLLL